MSLHPTMTNEELYLIINAIKEIISNIKKWEEDYVHDKSTNEFYHKNSESLDMIVDRWFE